MIPLPEINFRRTPVTLVVTAVAAALEVACTLDPNAGEAVRDTLRYRLRVDYRLGMLSPLWSGELWRPITASLMHGDIVHAAFNIYWMLIFGTFLERRYGSLRFASLLVLLAYVSMVPEFVISNWNVDDLSAQHGAVGLSGVGFGLFGLLFIGRKYVPEMREICSDSAAQIFAGWFVLCIVLTKTGVMSVANIAHAAGWIFGMLYGAAIYDRTRRPLWLTLSIVLSLVVLVMMFYVPGNALYERHILNEQVREFLRDGTN